MLSQVLPSNFFPLQSTFNFTFHFHLFAWLQCGNILEVFHFGSCPVYTYTYTYVHNTSLQQYVVTGSKMYVVYRLSCVLCTRSILLSTSHHFNSYSMLNCDKSRCIVHSFSLLHMYRLSLRLIILPVIFPSS